MEEFEAERNASEARDGLLQFESDQVRARLAEIDDALRDARQLLDQSRDRRAELSAAAAKLQSDAQYMAETCLERTGRAASRVDGRHHDSDRLRRAVDRRRPGLSRDAHPARRHGPGKYDGARGIQGNRRASRISRHTKKRSARFHREYAGHDQGDRHVSHARSSKRPSTRSTRTSRPRSASCLAVGTPSCA